ncbi:hypothetical protein CGCA056_v015168 [Colletotrichum aenigma]|uniref:uncharacterized protein n=1 Tax=Colletotrichum aenigma TaxID=1215731 RepID=UPI00187234A8|nr:uncharacterized protein CGCA056_v015168 [Colletotrichum aenigma]KAF5483057.1 hypothetical protein CGCA056_v015168 [Colletotrichum aenigma]
MASQTRTIIPDSATRRQREEELVATGVLTELRMVLSSDSNPDGSNNQIGRRLALKAAVCVNAANEQSSEQPSIIFSTSNERLSERLRTAVDLKAEGLAEAGASPGGSARVVALVSFYNGSINNTPDHAYVRLSVHVMDSGAARGKWFGVLVDDVATFSANGESGDHYYHEIMRGVGQLQLGKAEVRRPEGEVMSIDLFSTPVVRLKHFVMRDAGLSFAFGLEKILNPSTSAEKTLEEYISIFAGYAANAPMAATLPGGGPSYFARNVLRHRGVWDVDDDELISMGG